MYLQVIMNEKKISAFDKQLTIHPGQNYNYLLKIKGYGQNYF